MMLALVIYSGTRPRDGKRPYLCEAGELAPQSGRDIAKNPRLLPKLEHVRQILLFAMSVRRGVEKGGEDGNDL